MNLLGKAFFIGIKGVGMTSLALAMQDAGWEVSGSDTDESFITDEILAARHIPVTTPALAPIPVDTTRVIYSGAYDISSLESSLSQLESFPLAIALADFVKDRRVIAVAGVGGKTTTSAMLAAMFHGLGRDVGYYVGTGSIAGLGAPGHCGTDPWYIVEADEYAIGKTDPRPKFALLSPEIVITTNIVHDHPDIYKDENATLAAFTSLIENIPPGGTWICNPADPPTTKLITLQGPTLKGIKVMHYPADPSLELSVFGAQNQLDAQAAVLAAVAAGVSRSDAQLGIKAYHGAGRRQEFHGEVAGRLLYDDYGHHPAEILVTVKAFHEHFPGHRVLLVFESHTYTRTEALLGDFAMAIGTADQAFIMPIFESAREKGKPHQVTPTSFAAMIPGATALTWDNAAATVWAASRPGDIILTMGAGFVYKLHDKFKKMESK